MTDAEIICEWMEPKPKGGPFDCRPWHSVSPLGWWVATESRRMDAPNEWYPRPLTLDTLHEVEERIQRGARLATEIEPCILRNRYVEALSEAVGNAWMWHATAEQKIKALASVLRAGIRTPEVKP